MKTIKKWHFFKICPTCKNEIKHSTCQHCHEDPCLSEGCSQKSINGIFCSDHINKLIDTKKCQTPGCKEPSNIYNYCPKHKCPHCYSEIINNFCSQGNHNTKCSKCSNFSINEFSLFCITHDFEYKKIKKLCINGQCRNTKMLFSDYCCYHKCISCIMAKNPNSDYCDTHRNINRYLNRSKKIKIVDDYCYNNY